MNQQNQADPGDPRPGGVPALDRLDDEALRWFLALQAEPEDAGIRRNFESWRARDSRHGAAFAKVSGLWNSAEFGEAVRQSDRSDAAAYPSPVVLLNRSRPRATASWGRRIAAMAAVLVVGAALAQFTGLTTRMQADYVTATGEQQRIVLSDGSTMRLNSGSAVAIDFNRTRRSVRLLEGEAFFDVVRDPDRPFRVVGANADVEVTGTAFSVRSAAAGDDVTVQHGKVSVAPRTGNAAAIGLLPLQSIAVHDGKPSAVQTVDADTAFAWLEGRIRFRDRPLAQVLDEVSRHHRGVIVVADSRFNDIKVTGNYRLDSPALIVASLAEAVGARLVRVSDHVLILR